MERLGIPFEGRAHNGLVDSRNTAAIALHMVRGSMMHGSCLENGRHPVMASTLLEDGAPSASLHRRKAPAAPAHPGAPPEHLGSSPWPRQSTSGRPTVTESPLSTRRHGAFVFRRPTRGLDAEGYAYGSKASREAKRARSGEAGAGDARTS